jgi:PAS domain S-box-containing protein
MSSLKTVLERLEVIEMETTKAEILGSRHPLLEMVQVAFIITDVHAKILYANRHAERLFGYVKGEIEGQRIRSLFLEEDQTYFLPNIIYLTAYKSGFEGEVLLRQQDGAKIFVHLSTNAFREGGEIFLAFSLHEIQRLKKLERERLEGQHWTSLGKMVEEIAHQVRNPIVSLGGYTKRLQKALPSSQKGRYYLNQILRETRRLEALIQRVEEYVLIPRPTFQKINILEVIETALRAFSEKATERGILLNLETRTLKGDWDLFIDKGLLMNAISHILENSAESFTGVLSGKRRKTVNVALWGNDESVGILISDRGEGISKKNLNRIFEPFFSTRPDQVGLGLTIAKRAVEENMGNIQVESRSKKGTTVTIVFPKDRRRKVRRESIIPELRE